jgi:hypothetical protein
MKMVFMRIMACLRTHMLETYIQPASMDDLSNPFISTTTDPEVPGSIPGGFTRFSEK